MKGIKKRSYKSRREDVVVDPCPDCIANDVTIGTQIWTGCNSNTQHYRNGDSIPYVGDSITWSALTTGAWCYYDNDPATEVVYGLLYNWYAINDPRGIAPVGYKVPTDADWTTLTDSLGGLLVAGGKMKEEGVCHWLSPNTGATNTSLFTGLPGGLRYDDGDYNVIGYYGFWWSSTESDISNAWIRYLIVNDDYAYRSNYSKKYGLSLRFIKEPIVLCPDIVIGTQTWASCNLDVSTYRNGDIIPQITDNTLWDQATTGAWCWYNNDPLNGTTYKKLYNYYAITDPRGLAPIGYHIPTDTEWATLTSYVGGNTIAGGPLKESGTAHWQTPNTGADNSTGFTALPGGFRGAAGGFGYLTQYGYYRTDSNVFVLGYNLIGVFPASNNYTYGCSVRVIKD